MASYLSYLVERFIGWKVFKVCFLLVINSVEVLLRIFVLKIYLRYFGAKFNFGMQTEFWFFWKHRWILTYKPVFLIMNIAIIFCEMLLLRVKSEICVEW
jgi:hypothetical protein